MSKNFQKLSANHSRYQVNDDFIPELRGPRRQRTLREMVDNDEVVGAMLSAFGLVIGSAKWRVESCDDSLGGRVGKDFLESVMHDMAHTWADFVNDAVSVLAYGFAPFEIVLKNRRGPYNTSCPSSFDDGRIGVRSLSLVPQWTIDNVELDEFDEVRLITQYSSNTPIPRNKLLYLRTFGTQAGPWGKTILRNAYKTWYFKKKIQMIEAIAIERELTGIPVGKMPAEYFTTEDEEMLAVRSGFEEILRDVKNNEQGYIMLPSDTYKNEDGSPSSVPMVEFSLMSSSGKRVIDTDMTIKRQQRDMARTVLADFLMLGQEGTGSFALGKSRSGMFNVATRGVLSSIVDAVNKELVPKIWDFNGMPRDTMPKITADLAEEVSIGELADLIVAMSGIGVFLDDEDTVNNIRNRANLPSKKYDTV